MKLTKILKIVPIAAGVALASSSYGLTIGALTFTAVSPGVTLDGISGSGTLADPFVLLETVTGSDVTIQIDGIGQHGDTTGTVHNSGFVLRKVITNNSPSAWTLYDNELQDILGTPSGDGDGLSFAQGSSEVRPFTGNPLPIVVEIDLPRDYVNFSGGIVPIGGVLTIEYAITDNGDFDTFFLRQRPNIDFTGNPVPEAASTFGLIALAMGGLTVLRRKLS